MIENEHIRRRFAALLGERKLAEKIAVVTGSSRAAVFRWFDTGFPENAVIILEFMEITPVSMWPKRITAELFSRKIEEMLVTP